MQFGRLVLGVMLAGAIAGGWDRDGSGQREEAEIGTRQGRHRSQSLALRHSWRQGRGLGEVRTDKTLATLKSDPNYQRDYNSLLKVLNANDRIAFASLDHGDVFNFWQDAQHTRGLWRKTTIADYAKADPKWDVLLDVDKLAKDEKENRPAHSGWASRTNRYPTPRTVKKYLALSGSGSNFRRRRLMKLSTVRSVPK